MTEGDPLNWGHRASPFNGYDVAQVCVNGHMITSALMLMPGASKAFCPECGAPTITSCPKCNHAIRGSSTEVLSLGYSPPKYCEACGSPFPWTASSLEAAQGLAALLDDLKTMRSSSSPRAFQISHPTPPGPRSLLQRSGAFSPSSAKTHTKSP